MLSRLLKEHQQKQAQIRKQNDLLRKDAIDSVNALSANLSFSLNERTSQILRNQRAIEHDTKRLQAQTINFAKQTQQWLALIDGINGALKELGDVENWARVIEKDMREVVQILEDVHECDYPTSQGSALPSTPGAHSVTGSGGEMR
ncbi:uncharacterized protein VTP21DRAFT_4635 [Calcarisporiella thermophila]|uniref:uncharacterized protein n=1 Tax=Calcarisporiella thermophila TaxID=911321 RepID=UPI0037432144